MKTLYEFSVYNNVAVYGFGTEEDATQYLDWMNAGRLVNLFEMAISDLSEEQAKILAINLQDTLAELGLFDADED